MIENRHINVCDLDYILWYKIPTNMNGDCLVKLTKFASKYPVVNFDKFQSIEPENDGKEQENFYFILSGFVRLYLEKKSGEIFSVEIDSKNDIVPFIFNTISVKGYKLSTIKMDCLSQVAANKIPSYDLHEFFLNNREVFYCKLEETLFYTNSFLEKTPIIIYGSVKEKLATLLYNLSLEYPLKKAGRLFIEVELKHKDIASFIGATREATSIEMGNLKKAKVIDYEKHRIEILDKEKLAKIADN